MVISNIPYNKPRQKCLLASTRPQGESDNTTWFLQFFFGQTEQVKKKTVPRQKILFTLSHDFGSAALRARN